MDRLNHGVDFVDNGNDLPNNEANKDRQKQRAKGENVVEEIERFHISE